MKRLRKLLSNREIWKRVLVTLFVLIVFRLLANVPLPGIDMGVYQAQFATRSTSEANYLLTIFTGGLLDTPSIVGLGIGVYITASIIIQLLSSIIPHLENLSKEGERGKKVMDQYTRFLTLPLAFAYSIGYLLLLTQQTVGFDATGNPEYLVPRNAAGGISATKVLFMALILTAGSMMIMWLAEVITERGVANGASIMIMLGILSSLPALVQIDVAELSPVDAISRILRGEFAAFKDPHLLAFLIIVVGGILLIGLIVFITESTRKIPIQYARRQRSGTVQESFLPLKLNQTGVMPIIFASALLTMPQLIVPLLSTIVSADSPVGKFVAAVKDSFLFNRNSAGYAITYFVLIVVFALVYVFIAFKPDQQAENLQKSGGFIPGIRPGKSTEEYIVKVMLRLTSVGGVFLGLIALIPLLVGSLMLTLTGTNLSILSAVGGTSILIVIGVVLEAARQIQSYRVSQNYDKYVY